MYNLNDLRVRKSREMFMRDIVVSRLIPFWRYIILGIDSTNERVIQTITVNKIVEFNY